MSCRHDLANGTCIRCYPDNPYGRSDRDRVDPGPEEDYEPNMEGPGAVPADKPNQPDETASAPTLRCIAWCPDDGDETTAREYVGGTPKEIAEQHAEHVYYEQGTQREHYEIRVRATKGDLVREWDVAVDVEIQVSFDAAALVFPVKPSGKPETPTPVKETAP